MKILKTICFLALTLSCMKSPKLNKDFGPEVAAADISATLKSANLSSTAQSVQTVYQGEFASYDVNVQIENQFPIVVKQRSGTVVKRTDSASTLQFVIQNDMKELDENGVLNKPSSTQDTICIELVEDSGACTPGMSTDTGGESPLPSVFKNMNWRTLQTQSEETGIHWTYHNLARKQGSITTPDDVIKQPDCGGRKEHCFEPMITDEISWDQVDWSTESYPVKYSFKIAFSKDAPFLGAQVSSCVATTITIKEQRVAILQCQQLRNFNVGHFP